MPALVNYNRGLVGLRAIIKNFQGGIMAVATKRYHFLDDVEFVEPLTVYEVLKMAKLIGLYPLIIESSLENVIRLIIGKLTS